MTNNPTINGVPPELTELQAKYDQMVITMQARITQLEDQIKNMKWEYQS